MTRTTSKIEKLEDQLSDREFRLCQIEDILSMETCPSTVRSYRSQKTRCKNRIRDLDREIARIKAKAGA